MYNLYFIFQIKSNKIFIQNILKSHIILSKLERRCVCFAIKLELLQESNNIYFIYHLNLKCEYFKINGHN